MVCYTTFFFTVAVQNHLNPAVRYAVFTQLCNPLKMWSLD